MLSLAWKTLCNLPLEHQLVAGVSALGRSPRTLLCAHGTRTCLQLPSHGLCCDKGKRSVSLLSRGVHEAWEVLPCPLLRPQRQAQLLWETMKYVLNG